ncbi:hypothetical protein KA107_02820 [Candidatus Pacearchaeota archaeon]|nr:hypothetical protein [Candidatus Pacearchaeota archaeon]
MAKLQPKVQVDREMADSYLIRAQGAQASRKKGWQYSAALDYSEAGDYYVLAGDNIKAAECYGEFLKFVEEDKNLLDDHAVGDVKERLAALQKQGKLEKTVATASILTLLGSMFFLQSGFTGNAISNLTQTNSNWIGVGLFCVSIVCGIFVIRGK